MKKYCLIGVIIIFIIIIVLLFIKFRKKNIEVSTIKYFHFGYDKGYMVNANIMYEINYENDRYFVKVKPYGISLDDALEMEIGSDEVKKVEDILVEYKVSEWDGFQKSDMNVLDGNSFSLSVNFINDESIHASGYMRYPKGYREVCSAFDEFFMNIYNKNK